MDTFFEVAMRQLLDDMTLRRKRRGTVSHIRDAASVIIAEAPERIPVGKSGREGYQQRRARKLGEAARIAIRQAASAGESLRSIAANFHVSHETIRTIVQSG